MCDHWHKCPLCKQEWTNPWFVGDCGYPQVLVCVNCEKSPYAKFYAPDMTHMEHLEAKLPYE